ncbi:ribosome maturation protein sbds [Phtheirospermum japonicum]|uniref:Ribosome maturation protein sbds n=1 Tax=Phtheirospermum japonicum TaxID=374723 RepID=A0A830B0W6_9LAMI|nr:ribosome maturation protein sbds [Phtheirospermum japonicum]
MSRSLVQPVGQKRLTNVAVVRLKKHGNRFEIACYKNKVLSWRSHVEKDLDEVLQSQTVYSNVSKGVLAKAKDLMAAFGTDDQAKICLEILEKGELQVAGKERESQLSSQFRDIATIVMQKTINPETQRPYTISMIERLMHDIHFAVDPNSSSKKQALEVIRELQKQFPIKRSPMRLRLTVPAENISSLVEKLKSWNSAIISRDESGTKLSVICELEPGLFRECDSFVRSLQGRLDMLAVNVHADNDTDVDHYDELEDEPTGTSVQQQKDNSVPQLTEKLQKQTISAKEGTISSSSGEPQKQQQKCSTCDAFVGDAKEYREHFKSEWHKHNLRRKTRQLRPLTAEECMADMELGDSKSDLKDYSF